jgi:hypothetical protein
VGDAVNPGLGEQGDGGVGKLGPALLVDWWHPAIVCQYA